MREEHTSNTTLCSTANYGIETCPADEWLYAVGERSPAVTRMANGRNIKQIDLLMELDLTKEAALTRAEVTSIILYTGPMYQIYNTVLRKYPAAKYSELALTNSLFPTTICVMVSAIQKIARKMKLEAGQVLYRGLDGNMSLPSWFDTPDEHGCLGIMEPGFMSTTSSLDVAVKYTNIDKGSQAPKVFKIVVGSVDRGADISSYSQYEGEQEFLYVPRSFLEPVADRELLVTDKGIVQLLGVKVNANLKTVTIEEYEKRKKDLHLALFKLMAQDLEAQLGKVSAM